MSLSPLFSRLQGTWTFHPLSRARWVTWLLIWACLGYVLRYVYFATFVPAAPRVLWILSTALLTQTIILYYVFAYWIFPRTLYKGRFVYALIWLIIWHAVIYETNLALFYGLYQLGETDVSRFMKLFEQWGFWGFINNKAAIFWNFFWSFPNAIILLIIKAVNDIIKLRTQAIQLQNEKLALELDFLKAQIAPHFLFNTLNSVYARVFDSDETAADLVLRLSELMQYNLYETDQPRIALAKELSYIENYLSLERNRLSGQSVKISFTKKGMTEQQQIAPLLLIVFVENAFKHGVRTTRHESFVELEAVVDNETFRFTVRNNVAIKRIPDSDVRPGGVGLTNVERRLKAIYPSRYTLVVKRTSVQYTVCLTINLL